MKVAINGLGRIGRTFLRAAWGNPNFEIVAANSRGDIDQYRHLIKHDSVYREWDKEVEVKNDSFYIDDKELRYFEIDEPNKCPWKDLDVDIVLEATGVFTKKEEAIKHVEGGAKNVIITAPGKGEMTTVVYGVNEEEIDLENDKVFSATSCTTNCLVPVVKVLQDNCGIEKGFMTTVHAYTNGQSIQDTPHKKDLRRARAACGSIIPTTTGAAKGIGAVLKEMEGKMDGVSLRVPVPVVSICDLVFSVNKDTTAEEVNGYFEKASKEGRLKGVLGVGREPLVSADYVGEDLASVVDLELTKVVDKRLVKVFSWYDNEWGYVKQLERLLEFLSHK